MMHTIPPEKIRYRPNNVYSLTIPKWLMTEHKVTAVVVHYCKPDQEKKKTGDTHEPRKKRKNFIRPVAN